MGFKGVYISRRCFPDEVKGPIYFATLTKLYITWSSYPYDNLKSCHCLIFRDEAEIKQLDQMYVDVET